MCAYGVTLLLLLSIWIPHVVAQVAQSFQWKFGNNYIEDSFQECQSLPLVIESITNDPSALGVPPYYFIAFELGGVPTTTPIGSSNPLWQVTHKAGSSLMLTMVDSNNNTGGNAPMLYNVTAGSNSSCLYTPPDLSTLPSVNPNVTDTLTTCEPWGLTIKGGKKPYTVVLSATNSPVITNVTMGPEDDVFTFPDRADPNVQLMWQWGVSSNTVHTTGSSNTTCVGLVSSSKTTAQIQQQEAQAQAQAAEASRQRTLHLALGLALGLGVPTVLGIALFSYFCYRRRKNPREQRGIWDDQDTEPRPWHSDDHTEMREVDAASQYVSTPRSNKSGYAAPDSPSATPFMQVTPIPPVYFDRELEQAGVAVAPGSASRSSQSQSEPSTSAPESAQARKYREALQDRQHAPGSSSREPQLVSPRPVRMSTLPPPLLGAELDPEAQPDIIIQHRDGGCRHRTQIAVQPGRRPIPAIYDRATAFPSQL
ncbi:uncharacterized protein PHACADRAFT_263297 [Phanerochaete carnosa HHB-10118-sp]|uniref:Mid2 domain-containing protein n=1 Tax=Phanerochaete carnosa (strain HHB-10118-sp) TaxID=650164 RepID=K5VIX9_PHACS|nr:uncharacterized protein PHACADRAFT_263297 [Phanerochaete carnosa HHB-10118-sp]EKM51253.1 hypothetical protein PHACADRAFT_263297 [Phanerochaete carnosa HHB-10118-sp]